MATLTLSKISLPLKKVSLNSKSLFLPLPGRPDTGFLFGPSNPDNKETDFSFVQDNQGDALHILQFLRFQNIEALYTINCGADRFFISSFQGLENLKTLYFMKCGSKSFALPDLSSLTQLQTLFFQDCAQTGGFHITGLPPNLCELTFNRCCLTKPFQLHYCPEVPSLTTLTFTECATQSQFIITDVRFFAHLTTLKINECGKKSNKQNKQKNIFIIDEDHPLPADKVYLILDSLAQATFFTGPIGVIKLNMLPVKNRQFLARLAFLEQKYKRLGWEIKIKKTA